MTDTIIEHGQRYQKACFGPSHSHWFEIYEKPEEYPLDAKVRLLNGICVVMAHDSSRVDSNGRMAIALVEEERAKEYED